MLDVVSFQEYVGIVFNFTQNLDQSKNQFLAQFETQHLMFISEKYFISKEHDKVLLDLIHEGFTLLSS